MPDAQNTRADAPAPARRAILEVSGPEAREFLNGLVTNSTLAQDGPVFAALLTPQGKILHTLFLHPAPEGVFLDVAAEGAEDLLRRLTLFRLRRKIGIARREDLSVALGDFAGESAPADPRHPDLPPRAVTAGPERADWAAYESARIAAGVPDQGSDFGAEEVFPHDVNMDLQHGLDMKKGCFVGQEVVSRMHRKGGVRKRICAIAFDGPAPQYGAGISDGSGADLGSVRSASGRRGLALVRIDRLAQAQGVVAADGQSLTVAPPPV